MNPRTLVADRPCRLAENNFFLMLGLTLLLFLVCQVMRIEL